MPMRILMVLVLGSLLATSCRARSMGEDGWVKTWTEKQPHAALQSGVTMRGSYYASICPRVPDWYVVKRDGTFVETFDELLAVLRPIDSPERALAYRDLLKTVQLERDETLTALQRTTPLTYRDADRASYEAYVGSDAARWGIGTEPDIQTTAAAIVITQPMHHWVDISAGDSAVELVRETFHVDGRYERDVVRTLETGESAEVHQPFPVF